MDLFEIFMRVIAAAAGAVLMALVWYLVRQDQGKTSGTGVMEYGIVVKVIGIVGAAVFLAAGYFTWVSSGFKDLFALSIFISLLFMGLALVVEAVVVRIRYNDRGIFTISPWRPSREIPWHSITGYRWSDINKWHILETRGCGMIRLSMYLRGIEPFFQALYEKNAGMFQAGSVTLDEINQRNW